MEGVSEKSNARLEAFCDGVFAIALTLLVLEFKTPALESVHASEDLWRQLARLLPSLSAFLLSFAIIAISWVGHHGSLRQVRGTTPKFIYANIFMLLSIVLFPFATDLLAEFAFTPFASPAVVVYCGVILLTNIGWILLTHTALAAEGLPKNQAAREELAVTRKNAQQGFFLYAACTVLAFWFPLVAAGIVSLTWVGWLLLGISLKENR